jgi:hypothetical protein
MASPAAAAVVAAYDAHIKPIVDIGILRQALAEIPYNTPIFLRVFGSRLDKIEHSRDDFGLGYGLLFLNPHRSNILIYRNQTDQPVREIKLKKLHPFIKFFRRSQKTAAIDATIDRERRNFVLREDVVRYGVEFYAGQQPIRDYFSGNNLGDIEPFFTNYLSVLYNEFDVANVNVTYFGSSMSLQLEPIEEKVRQETESTATRYATVKFDEDPVKNVIVRQAFRLAWETSPVSANRQIGDLERTCRLISLHRIIPEAWTPENEKEFRYLVALKRGTLKFD